MSRVLLGSQDAAQPAIFTIGEYTYDVERKSLLQPNGQPVKLRPKSRQVLEVLLRHQGTPVARDTLSDIVWKGVYVTDDALTHCIKEIRTTLNDSDKVLLQTVPKVGYTLHGSTLSQQKIRTRDTLNWKKVAVFVVPIFVVGTAILLLVLPQLLSQSPNEFSEQNPVIKVQQFESLSDDARWERLAFGLSLEIASELSTNDLLTVHSVKDTRSFVSDFDGFILKGALLPDGDNNLHVSAQLLDAGNENEVVWNNRWNRPLAEFFDIQHDIVSGIDSTLAPFWSGKINTYVTSKTTRRVRDLNAYELYLKGIEEKHKFTPDGYEKAESYLQQALRIDPSFSEAWTTLAVVYLNLGINAKSSADKKAFREKRAKATIRGYELAPDNSDTLVQWSWLNAYEGKWQKSEQAMRRAVKNAGNDGDILAVAALAGSQHVPLGGDAVEWSSRAISLRTPYPPWYNLAAGIAAFHTDDYVQARDHLESAPNMAQKFLYLAATYQQLKNAGSARKSVQSLKKISSEFTISGYIKSVSMGPRQQERLVALAETAGVPMGAKDVWTD